MQEIIIKKVSVTKTSINQHLLETVKSYIKNNKEYFNTKDWLCAAKTSRGLTKNILFDVSEFIYIRKAIEDNIEKMFLKNFNKAIPFSIRESWINVLGVRGYQEFHVHGDYFGSGVLYVTDENSDIEFAVFPDVRKRINPKKGDLLIFEATTFHRVLDSEKERISLAFNF